MSSNSERVKELEKELRIFKSNQEFQNKSIDIICNKLGCGDWRWTESGSLNHYKISAHIQETLDALTQSQIFGNAMVVKLAKLQLENAKFRDVLEFYKCFSDSRISSIAKTALLNITTAEEVTHNKPIDERKEFEDWLEDFKAQHEEWRYADSEAMYFAAWQARANLSM